MNNEFKSIDDLKKYYSFVKSLIPKKGRKLIDAKINKLEKKAIDLKKIYGVQTSKNVKENLEN